ncbi:MAG: hypothetical protein HZA92_19915 [Verrucomicrobia bacterium]|nr:hypothetical protein [Verrucomicrobiota bacterium]
MDQLQQKLMAVAKASPPGDHVPYAFEKRIMARLIAPLPVDVWAVWGRWLWRAVAPCMSVMAALGLWVIATMHPEQESQNLEQAIENTLLSSDDVAGE